MKWKLERVEAALAGAALVLGIAAGFQVLSRGAWLDEFWTLASTQPGNSWTEFWTLMMHEVHPPLYYLLVQTAQKIGIHDLVALRALNLLGIPLVLFTMWYALRRQSLTAAQVCVLTAIYAASPMFLDTFAELRAYFLLYSAAIAVAVMARVLLDSAVNRQNWSWQMLALWGVCVAIFVNLHYFATLMGGLLTFALVLTRRDQKAIPFLSVSALAAAPAVILFGVQRLSTGPDITSWIQTGRIDAILLMLDQSWSAGAGNIVAFGVAITLLLIALESRDRWGELQAPLLLGGVLVIFFAILTLVNTVEPIVIDRYLIAGGGCLAAALAIISAGPRAPRWTVVAICMFAVFTQSRVIYKSVYDREGWAVSAASAASMVSDCPATRVFTQPSIFVGPDDMYTEARRLGYQYYSVRYGLEPVELQVGDTLPPPGNCPNVIWMEHILDPVPDIQTLLGHTKLEFTGRVDMVRAGTGVLLVNSAAAP